MAHVINVTVRGKVATADAAEYVCGNSDYTVHFDFDAEWGAYNVKTARFVYGSRYQDVVFTGKDCHVPVIENAYGLNVGVYAGDLCTTTPAYVKTQRSILCGGGTPAAPDEDVYAQIMEKINAGMLKGDPGEPGYTPVKGVDYFDGEPGPQGDPGAPGKDGTDATVTTESIKTALGYTPADDAAMAAKLTEPDSIAVGKYFRIAAIDEAGHAVLEAVDAPVGGLSTEPSLWPAWTAEEQDAALKKIGGAFAGWKKIEKITIAEYVNNLVISLNDYQDLYEIVIVVDANGTGAECKYKISVNSSCGYEFLHWNDASTIKAEPYTTYVHLSKIGNYWKSESINPKSPSVYAATQSSKIIPYNKRQHEYNCVISTITLIEYDLGVGSAVYVMTR